MGRQLLDDDDAGQQLGGELKVNTDFAKRFEVSWQPNCACSRRPCPAAAC